MKETVKVRAVAYQPSGSCGGASDGPSCVVGVAGPVIGRAQNAFISTLEIRQLSVSSSQLVLWRS